MKNHIISRVLFVLAILVILINTAFSVVNSLNPDINVLPQGKLILSSVSPEGSSRVNFYLVENNLGCAVRGERVIDGSKSNIYWQTNIDSVDAYWVDEYGIVINNIPLNIKTDKFDSRRGTAIFSDGVLAENINDNDKKSNN